MTCGVWEEHLWRDAVIEVVARQRVALSGAFLGAMLFGFSRKFAHINRKLILRTHTSHVVFSFEFGFRLPLVLHFPYPSSESCLHARVLFPWWFFYWLISALMDYLYNLL